MRLSLIVRCAESPRRKDVALLPFEELAAHAARVGFRALWMRALGQMKKLLGDRI